MVEAEGPEELLDEAVERGLIACPIPSATALAVVLKPLDVAAELKRVVVTPFEPASIASLYVTGRLETEAQLQPAQ